jgi:hypothetical protein
MENIKSVEINRVNVNKEVSKFVLKIGIVATVLIGVWGTACFIGGIASAGSVGALIKSYFVAISV